MVACVCINMHVSVCVCVCVCAELVNIVRHLQNYPKDSVPAVLRNVLAFDQVPNNVYSYSTYVSVLVIRVSLYVWAMCA